MLRLYILAKKNKTGKGLSSNAPDYEKLTL